MEETAPIASNASNEARFRKRINFELRTKKDLDFDFEPNQVQVKSTGFRPRSGRFRPRSGGLGPGQAGSDQVRQAQARSGAQTTWALGLGEREEARERGEGRKG